jgi:hypothetical protein
MLAVAVLRCSANWRSSSQGRAYHFVTILIYHCAVFLVGEVNGRLIVRAACNEKNCLWAVSWSQSEYNRGLKQVRTAVENWDVVLNVFGRLRYIHTHAYTYIHTYILTISSQY